MPFNNSANSATQPYIVKYDSDTPYSPSSYTGPQKSQWIENTGSSAISVLNYNNQIVKIEPGQISFFYKTDSNNWVNTDRTSEIKRLTTTETNLIAGDYDIDSTLSSFSISLADMKGVWRFHNTNHSISSNTVTLTSLSSQTYTNEGGVQIDDDFIINASGKPFVVLHTEIGDDYRVSVEPSMGLVSATTTDPALPYGALGVWLFKNFRTANNNPIVQNLASHESVHSKQLLRHSRRIARHQGNWVWQSAGIGTGAQANIQAVANAAGVQVPVYYMDKRGVREASRLTVVSTGGALYQVPRFNLMTGMAGVKTATIAADVRLVSGTGKFKLGGWFMGASYLSPEFTATGEWVRYSWTGNILDAYAFGIGHDAPTGDTTLDINNINVYAGSIDLGPEVFGGHLRMGLNTPNSYSYANGEVTATLAAGLIQFETAHQPFETTILLYGTPITPWTDPLIQGILSQPSGDGYTFGLNTPSGGLGLSYGPDYGSASYPLITVTSPPITAWNTTTPTLFAVRWNGTTCTWWENGVIVRTGTPVAGNTPTIDDLLFNCLTSHPAKFKYKAMAYYARALSNAEMKAAGDYLLANA